MSNSKPWWLAEKGTAHNAVIPYVQQVENDQFDLFDRFVKLAFLYDPNDPSVAAATDHRTSAPGVVTENVIASNVDTVTAVVAAVDVRARFMTDDGDWSTQKMARRLEWYAEGLTDLLCIAPQVRRAFKDAAIKGTGLVKVYADEFDEIHVERIQVDDIIVDDRETQGGASPKHLHRRIKYDREELIAQFPEYEQEIRRAQTTGSRDWSRWAGYRPIAQNEVVAIESIRLPIGKKGKKGYVAGRRVIVIDGCDIVDEEWHKPHYGIARMVWSERLNSWYGIGGAERILGHQRTLNKRNTQIDRQLDLGAFPTTYVRQVDAKLAQQTMNRVGNVVVISGDEPKTIIPPAVSAETYQNRTETKSSAFEEFGVSRMAAQSVKPAGIDSGVAMREYRDQTTQRFAMQEKAFEQFWLDVIYLALDCCKDLGADAPVITKKAKFGARKIKWSQVDMGDVRVQIAAAANLSRTPAGRYQMALEWAQAGVISTDEWRRLTEHPDLDRVLSMYTQGIDSIEKDIEAIEEGKMVVPEPFGNLQLMVRTAQMAYLRDRDLGAPEEILEALRTYAVQAAEILSRPAPAQNTDMPMPGAMPLDPSMPMDPAMAMAGPPMTGQPVAALAPEAMNLMAS